MVSGWPRKPLGEVASIVSGFAFKSSEFGANGVPVIKIKNIRVGSVDLTEVDCVNEKFLALPQRYHVRGGDVLISLTGSHISQPNSVVGRVARHSANLPNCLLNQRGGKVIVRDPGICDLTFLFYILNQSETVRDIALKAHGAANQANVSPSQVESVEVPLPPLPVQHRIAGILSAYDDLIENNLQRIRILEEMARTLYREWFVHFRFPGHGKVKRVASLLGLIPTGWEVRKLSDLVATQYGYTESANIEPVGPKYLRGMDINKTSYIEWSQVPYCPITLEEQPLYSLKKGDVVVIRMADPGKVGIVEEDVEAVFASYLIRVTPKSDMLSPYFLFHTLDSPEYQNYILGTSTGTTRKSASAGVMTDFQFTLPSKNLVDAFEKRATSIRSLLTTFLKQTANLRRTRDLLLPRLLSGQILIEV
jgi:type I restriction enzyme S subunit